MPITRLSYHIADFLQDSSERVYILELGNAFYRSAFGGREISGVNVKKFIMNHAKSLGTIEKIYPAVRRPQNRKNIPSEWGEDEPLSPIVPAEMKKPLTIKQVEEREGRFNYHEYTIRELFAQTRSTPELKEQVVLDGVPDLLSLCDRDKRIFHTFLELNNLSSLQPRTWYYSCHPDNTAFLIPDGIEVFIIKQSNGSLAEGICIVPKDDLLLVLEAIAKKNVSLLPPAKRTLYGEAVTYYCRPSEHQDIVIQELHYSKPIEQTNGSPLTHHAAGRAVFAIIEEDAQTRVEFIDLFWQLTVAPISSEAPLNERIISAKSHQRPTFNCWPSLSTTDKDKLDPQLKKMLTAIATAAHHFDLHDFVFALYAQGRDDDIRYLLKDYSHTRVDRLDLDFITAISFVNPELANAFLIQQAKHYLLPHHLFFPQGEALENWLYTHLAKFTPKQQEDLRQFINTERENMYAVNPMYAVNYQKAGCERYWETCILIMESSKEAVSATLEFKQDKARLSHNCRLYSNELRSVLPFFGRKVTTIIAAYSAEIAPSSVSQRKDISTKL